MSSGESRTTKGRGRLYDSITDTIGDTPCIRINALAPEGVRVYVKAEFFNPAASVKDRLARLLNRPEGTLRVIAPDVGGGFGEKGSFFPEEVAVPYLSMLQDD